MNYLCVVGGEDADLAETIKEQMTNMESSEANQGKQDDIDKDDDNDELLEGNMP